MARLVRLDDDVFARLAYLVGQLHLKRRRFVSASEAVEYSFDKCGVPRNVGKGGKKLNVVRTALKRKKLKRKRV